MNGTKTTLFEFHGGWPALVGHGIQETLWTMGGGETALSIEHSVHSAYL